MEGNQQNDAEGMGVEMTSPTTGETVDVPMGDIPEKVVDFQDDPFAKRDGRHLVWKDVNMSLLTSNGETSKKILDNVWGEVPAGHITAIMGPSGSGKSSLLNVLSGRAQTSGNIKVESDVRLNNVAVDPTDINVRKQIAFVAQDDSLQVTSTPREAIMFSAKLRLPGSTPQESLVNMTNRILSELGLTECADTFVGGDLLKGISGGERKRTSVGVELVTRPALTFLDEPTSGLDAYNALQLCRVLKKVANAGSTVLFTIHQPSSEIFNSLDMLVLMNKGRVMYNGAVADVGSFFSDHGHPVPPNYNPADHVMHVALLYPISELDSAGYFPKDHRKIGPPTDPEHGQDELGITVRSGRADDGGPPGMGTQVQMLFQRELNNLKRSKEALKVRIVMSTAISSLVGCIFFQVAKTDFTNFINVQSTFGSLLMACLSNVFATALPSLVTFPEERPVFLREYSTNHYSVVSYFLSRLTTEFIVTALQVTISSAITYNMVGFTCSFGPLWCILYTVAMTSTALGIMIGCSVENATVAIEFLPALFMPQILFAGFFVPPHLIPIWLRWISYISPLTYAVRLVLIEEFGGDRCAGLTPNICETILSNVEADPDEAWWYWVVLVSIFVFCRLLALVILRQKANKFY